MERFRVERVKFPEADDPVLAVYATYRAGPGCERTELGRMLCLEEYYAEVEYSGGAGEISRIVTTLAEMPGESVEVNVAVPPCHRFVYRNAGSVGPFGELMHVCKAWSGVSIDATDVKRLSGQNDERQWVMDRTRSVFKEEFGGDEITHGEPRKTGFDMVITVEPPRARVVPNRWERYRAFAVISKDGDHAWIIDLFLLGEYSSEGTRKPRQWQIMHSEHDQRLEGLLTQLRNSLVERFK